MYARPASRSFLFPASIAQQYHVSKYPTLKLFRHGSLMKREYRGQRSGDALANYIKDMLKSTVNEVEDIDDLDNLDVSNQYAQLQKFNNVST